MGRRGRTQFTDERTFFVTTTVVNFARVFTEDRYCDLLISNINHYRDRYGFAVHAFVIMPSHFHWIITIDRDRGTLSDLMRDLKKYSAWDVMRALVEDGRNDLGRLFVAASPSERRDQSRKFWMARFDDAAIRSQEMMRQKIDYIHQNPVAAGLVRRPSDFKYSSARNYELGDHSILAVKTDW